MLVMPYYTTSRPAVSIFLMVDRNVVDAVRKLAMSLPEFERVAKSRESQAVQEQFSSLEETQSTSVQHQFKDAPQLIRYVVLVTVVISIFGNLSVTSSRGRRFRGTMLKSIVLP